MPLERGFPRFIPRFFGTKLKVIIGPSITSKVRPLLDSYHSASASSSSSSDNNGLGISTGVIIDIKGRKTRPKPPYYEGDPEELKALRREIAALLRGEVEALGRRTREDGIAKGLKKGHEAANHSKEVIEG